MLTRAQPTKAVKSIPYNFGAKHLKYIKHCDDAMINVAEGAVRAGKTVDNVIAFCRALCKTRDKIHLATASTQAVAKAVIGDCNGFGIEHYFRGQCRWGKYEGNEALFICGPKTRFRMRVIVFVGGALANSFQKFRGFSIGMWIATEINLHHDKTIKEAFNRQLAAKDRKVFWDLNPSPPEAAIYKDYIDLYAKKQRDGDLAFGYNYEQFTIFDNINISDDVKKQIISQYTEGSVWYRRDIKGERCSPEGLIFPLFAEKLEEFVVDEYPKNLRLISVGIDFGGTNSKTTFTASGIVGNFTSAVILADHKIDGGKGTVDVDLIVKELWEFVSFLRAIFPMTPIVSINCDCAEQAIINTIRAFFRRRHVAIPIQDSIKGTINNRIFALSALMSQRRLTVHKDCKNVIGSYSSQVWDPDEPTKFVRLDNGTKDIDTADATEYSLAPYFNALGVKGGGEKSE